MKLLYRMYTCVDLYQLMAKYVEAMALSPRWRPVPTGMWMALADMAEHHHYTTVYKRLGSNNNLYISFELADGTFATLEVGPNKKENFAYYFLEVFCKDPNRLKAGQVLPWKFELAQK